MMATILSGYLQQFFRVSAVLFLGISWGHRFGWAVFIKFQGTVFHPALSSQSFCVGVFSGDILLFRSGSILGHFLVSISYFYLLLYLYYYPLLFSFYLVFFIYLLSIYSVQSVQCSVYYSLLLSLYYTFGVFTIATYVHYYSVRFCFT